MSVLTSYAPLEDREVTRGEVEEVGTELVSSERGAGCRQFCRRENAGKIMFVLLVVGACVYIAIDSFTTQYILGWMIELNKWIQVKRGLQGRGRGGDRIGRSPPEERTTSLELFILTLCTCRGLVTTGCCI